MGYSFQFYLYMAGKLNLICGPMYSGKTSELCRRYTRYKLAGKKCLLIKYKNVKQKVNKYKFFTIIKFR